MPQRELPSLADADWLCEPRLQEVLRVLNVGGETRVVGGAVRNALLGVAVADVDLATTLRPEQVTMISKQLGFGVHPTGIDHGTVTVVNDGAAFEVTTLRNDIETDGRRAVVSFTHDWSQDAARRDFTINAMYCDGDGKIYDFTNSYEDIFKRKVRFVGIAPARIREDYLRILRFFRFHAWYGHGKPDEAGFKACVCLRSGLKTLSVERVRQELLKLLAAPMAVKVLKLMAEAGILKIILPHTEDWRLMCRVPNDALLRLFVLAQRPEDLKVDLRMSNAEALRLHWLVSAPLLSPALTQEERRRLLYHVGVAGWSDAVQLSWAKSRAKRDDAAWAELLDLPQHWLVPKFSVAGVDLLLAGFAPGPEVGRTLAALEDWWVASDFKPTRNELLVRAGRYKD
jgi:poly(A) polymerase